VRVGDLGGSQYLGVRILFNGYVLTICKPDMLTKALKTPNRLIPGGEDMMNQNEAKTRTIGYLPIEKVQALKGWADYLDKSNKLSSLRTETQKAKNAVRDALKQRLNETGEIDFATEGDRIRVFQVFRKQHQGRRMRSIDLSASFHEQSSEVGSEMSDPLTDELPANLDPVTERLTTLLRQRMER
jgi:hypothetical protein